MGGPFLTVQEARDDGGDAGTGETAVRRVSFCESACEDASDASKTAGALAYSAKLDSPAWMSGGGDFPRLQEGEETATLDMPHKNKVIVWCVLS